MDGALDPRLIFDDRLRIILLVKHASVVPPSVSIGHETEIKIPAHSDHKG